MCFIYTVNAVVNSVNASDSNCIKDNNQLSSHIQKFVIGSIYFFADSIKSTSIFDK